MQAEPNEQILRKTTSKTFHLHPRNTSNSANAATTPLKRSRNDESSGHNGHVNAEHDVGSSSKRQRTADWPLKNETEELATETSKSTSSETKTSHRKRKSKSAIRPSKFQEGSLNDKPSKHPPPSYIGEDEAMERYHSNKVGMSTKDGTAMEAGTEASKSSGMFRFGRAIANVLNPTSVWQGINGIWKEKEVAECKKGQQGDQQEINDAYAAFKEGGFQGLKTTNTVSNTIQSQAGSSRTSSDTVRNPLRNSFRDSAIDMGDESYSNRTSQDTKPGSTLKVPASPQLEPSSGRRSFSQLRSPSFGNLKKVKSNIQLPSPRRKHAAAPVYPSIDSVVATEAETNAPGLKRQPSKKDIARVNKLNKRVSDLELKLETARQELKQSLREAPPVPDVPANVGRASFVPGALGSLPSERLLDQRIEDVVRATQGSSAAAAVVSQDTSSRVAPSASTPAAQSWLQTEPEGSKANKKHISSAIKSSSSKAARDKSTTKKSVVAPSLAGIQKKPLPKLPHALRNYSLQAEYKVPPIPAQTPPTFDISTIDRKKIAAMRSARDVQTPIGAADDDVPNLRKMYPSMTEQQLNDFIADSASRRRARHIPVQQTKPSVSPYVSRPQPASPMRTRSRVQKRGISPPPPSLASAKKSSMKLREGEFTDGNGDTSPVLGRQSSEPRKIVLRRSSNRINQMKGVADKPLPDVQKEDFEWDEDVF